VLADAKGGCASESGILAQEGTARTLKKRALRKLQRNKAKRLRTSTCVRIATAQSMHGGHDGSGDSGQVSLLWRSASASIMIMPVICLLPQLEYPGVSPTGTLWQVPS
jgi:hypothetical protein